jgi:hypothetical protein
VSGEGQQCRMEADRIATSLQNRTFEVVIVMCPGGLCGPFPASD